MKTMNELFDEIEMLRRNDDGTKEWAKKISEAGRELYWAAWDEQQSRRIKQENGNRLTGDQIRDLYHKGHIFNIEVEGLSRNNKNYENCHCSYAEVHLDGVERVMTDEEIDLLHDYRTGIWDEIVAEEIRRRGL